MEKDSVVLRSTLSGKYDVVRSLARQSVIVISFFNHHWLNLRDLYVIAVYAYKCCNSIV